MNLYEQHHRRRLSSTGEGSGDSSTTASGSTYGEKDSEGSEGRAESENSDAMQREQEDARSESPVDVVVSELEKQQVEYAYRGLKTQVYVSGCLANLYTKSQADKEWQIRFTGIPVVLHDEGVVRSRTKRRIQILLAERGTSFMLWRDTIDNLTSYKVSSPTFHTMYYSEDHSIQIGFSFDQDEAAHDMWAHIEHLVADPENICLSTPGKKKKKKERKQPKPAPLPPKTQISLPCCFQHITQVEHADRGKFFSLKEYVPLTSFMPKLRASREEL